MKVYMYFNEESGSLNLEDGRGLGTFVDYGIEKYEIPEQKPVISLTESMDLYRLHLVRLAALGFTADDFIKMRDAGILA